MQPDRRIREEHHEAGRAPEQTLAPGRAAAPGEDRDNQESEPDCRRDVRDSRPDHALDAVRRRPRVAVNTGRGVVPVTAGRRGTVSAGRRPITGRQNEGPTLVPVHRAAGTVRMDLRAVAVRRRTVAGRGLVRLGRVNEAG